MQATRYTLEIKNGEIVFMNKSGELAPEVPTIEYKIEFFNLENNYCHFTYLVGPNMQAAIDYKSDAYKNVNVILVVISSTRENIIKYFDKKEEKFIEICDERYVNKFDHALPPIIVTGSTGGGTSIVFKFLIACGLYQGTDCGGLNIYKPLESPIFKSIFKHRVNLSHKPEDIDILSLIYSLKTYFQFFWSNRSIENTIWGFKLPSLGVSSLILSRAFPEAKFVSVIRAQDGFYSNSEGKAFHERDLSELLEDQYINLEGNSIFHVDFYKLFEDHKYANKLLTYCGLNKIKDTDEFNIILNRIGFKKEVLKNKPR